MKQVNASTLGMELSFDIDKYAAVIYTDELNENKRLYFVCYRSDLKNPVIPIYFTKTNSNTIDTWYKEIEIVEQNIIESTLIEKDIELITKEGPPKITMVKRMIECQRVSKDKLIELK